MKPFKLAYNEICEAWMRRNPGLRITNYDIAGLVNETFTKSCKMEIAKNGFSCTGIYPFCTDVFSDFDFLSAEMTDVPEVPDETATCPDQQVRPNLIQPETSYSAPSPLTSHGTTSAGYRGGSGSSAPLTSHGTNSAGHGGGSGSLLLQPIMEPLVPDVGVVLVLLFLQPVMEFIVLDVKIVLDLCHQASLLLLNLHLDPVVNSEAALHQQQSTRVQLLVQHTS